MNEVSTEADQTDWKIFISGYGIYDFAGTGDEARAEADRKRRWEGAPNSMYWRSDLLRPYDVITSKIAAEFSARRGVPLALWKKRGRLLAKLDYRP